jgi:ATP-binding cassette subfamily B protein/subfamily B ATP-binding cassette protein MsbA
MNDFGRVVKLALRRRFAIAGILCSSLLIALLWGANISVLFPLVEIVFRGKGLTGYVEERLVESRLRRAELVAEAQGLQQQFEAAAPRDQPAIQSQLKFVADQQQRQAATEAFLVRIQPTIDRVAPATPYRTLLLLVGVLVGGTAIKLIALVINMLLVQYVSERTSRDIRAIFFRKALSLDLDSFGENGSAHLTSRLTNDTSYISAGLTILVGRLVNEPLKMLVSLGGAAYFCPRLLLLVLIITPAIAVVMRYLSKAIRRASRRAMEEMSQLYGLLNNAFSGIRVVKAFNTQAYERAKFQQGATAFYIKSLKVAFYNALARSSSEMLGMTTVGLAILAGGYLVVNQQTHLFGLRMSNQPLSTGQILTFFGFLIGASDPARKLSDVWSGLQQGIAAATRVFQVIDQPVRVRDPITPRDTPRPHAEIRFDKVAYQYQSGPTVLRGIDLTIRHGETIAVVGPNGSGKSTLVSLLCRFDDPQAGQLLLDDVPVRELRIRDLRKRIALVTQRTVLFDDTIENNIRYGSPGADSHDVVRAAKMAFADSFIRHKTTDGYKTMLGASGMRLSGGQMQRIALARAFLRNPDILILDEATSQIDMESEHLIHQALRSFLQMRTGIMITHRPSSLTMADRIVVLEAGQVADSGQHEELITRNSFYQSLCGNDLRKSA